jgi:hypothetical protein
MRASLASPPSLSRVHTSLALLTKKTLLDMLKTALKRTPDLAETAHLRRLFSVCSMKLLQSLLQDGDCEHVSHSELVDLIAKVLPDPCVWVDGRCHFIVEWTVATSECPTI